MRAAGAVRGSPLLRVPLLGIALLCASLLCVSLLSGCTGAPQPSPTDPAPDGVLPSEPATHPHVLRSCPLDPAFHYDAQALPASEVDAAYVCTSQPWTDDPYGIPRTIQFVDRVPQERVAALLETFTEPDLLTVDGCGGKKADPLIVWLHHDGTVTPVRAPLDVCGAPREHAASAYAETPLNRVLTASETKGFSNG